MPIPVADYQAVGYQTEDKDLTVDVKGVRVVVVQREDGIPGVDRNVRGGVAEDADLVLARSIPVADDNAVGSQTESKSNIARPQVVVFIGVEDEFTVAVGQRAEDAEVCLAVAVPVPDDRLVASLAEGERVTGQKNAAIVEIELPNTVQKVTDFTGAAAGPVASDAAGARRAYGHAASHGNEPL